MLRRRLHCATATTAALGGGWGGGHHRTPTRAGFFDSFNEMSKKIASSAQQQTQQTGGQQANSSSSGGPFPPGLDMQKLKVMQDMFNSQPPEKQEQLIKQALEMQKMMSKMPGFKKMSQMNTQVLEEIMKQKQQAATSPDASTGGGSSSSSGPTSDKAHPFAGVQTPRASSGSSSSSSAPTLDDLKKINLGPEIEALFEELRAIRKKKNEYRDLFNAEKDKADTSEKNRLALESSERTLRAKLKKAEQEVMLLTSENMEVRDSAKNVKQLSSENVKLKAEVMALKEKLQSGTAAGSPQYVELQGALQAKEEALRSLGRKVERMRRRDPLLHFSLCCNDITRLCELKPATSSASMTPAAKEIVHHMNNSGRYLSDELARELAEERFAELQSAYVSLQQQAWLLAAAASGSSQASAEVSINTAGVKSHAAASAYVAFVRRLFLTKVPFGNYDSVITVKDRQPQRGIAALKQLFASLGYTVEKLTDAESTGGDSDKYVVCAGADATTHDMLLAPGPFACAFALRVVTNNAGSGGVTGGADVLPTANKVLADALGTFTVTHAQPIVSETLLRNSNRVAVSYESSRASGPGGQAVNVAETQIKAKLFIDQNASLSRNAIASSNSITVDGVTLRVVGNGEGSDGASSSGSAAGSTGSAAGAGTPGGGGAAGGGQDSHGDGGSHRAFAFCAEAQDSRSALQNKTSATEKLLSSERRRYNDGPLRSPFGRCEEIELVWKRYCLAEVGDMKLEADIVRWCAEAAAAASASLTGTVAEDTLTVRQKGLTVLPLDVVLVLAFKRLLEEAKH